MLRRLPCVTAVVYCPRVQRAHASASADARTASLGRTHTDSHLRAYVEAKQCESHVELVYDERQDTTAIRCQRQQIGIGLPLFLWKAESEGGCGNGPSAIKSARSAMPRLKRDSTTEYALQAILTRLIIWELPFLRCCVS